MLVYFILIFICYLYYLNNESETALCRWSINKKIIKRDYRRDNQANIIFHLFRTIGFKYFLSYGSLLGAYRNAGYIPGDNDFDITVPIWLNNNIFHCKERISLNIYKYGYRCIQLNDSCKICNKTKKDYNELFLNYTKKYITNITYISRSTHSKFIFKNFFVDIYFMMGDEDGYRAGRICKCKFGNTYTYCIENALPSLKSIYGDDYNIPKKKKIQCNVTIINDCHF